MLAKYKNKFGIKPKSLSSDVIDLLDYTLKNEDDQRRPSDALGILNYRVSHARTKMEKWQKCINIFSWILIIYSSF